MLRLAREKRGLRLQTAAMHGSGEAAGEMGTGTCRGGFLEAWPHAPSV